MTKAKDWYSPSEIHFKREEILWVLQYIEMIEEGNWPPDFKHTGYTGGSKGKRFGPAYFEVPVTISAEVSRRLDMTGADGKVLFWQVQAGETIYESLEYEAQCALNFMSIWDFRKRPAYSKWRKNWRYHHRSKCDHSSHSKIVIKNKTTQEHHTKKRNPETYREFKDR